ncbi:ribonuclease Z [Longimicrobium terrae]|uniref:Ribonuclease Z n=1 Tax=Longimicrobium terrae TaxID=1639882 RepID=A0A841GX56_9BACT|nr:ribonuclease Z [Longimicrobium terrae]MBB4635022.1 ribonuclease Z [Longimicrobium terrae]MBB6069416.1 ribonuclease Z [Longimicrobium terrae]NNC31778.1 ribonuclease Z [Longimicrobium terrae]
MRVTFLGTAAARPTVGRNVSSLIMQREGDTMMFDCGEGTQRQMMRYGTGFAFSDIFFTHLHADHFLGVIGLLRTLGLQAREEPVHLWTPRGTADTLRQAVDLGVERVPFEVPIHELEPGEAVKRGDYDVVPFRTQHAGRSLGYAVVEHPRMGRFNAALARELGIPEGPLWGKLHHGETVEVDGRVFDPGELVGEARPGRRVVYTGDTRPTAGTREHARDADLLIHEATFAQDEADRAVATGHSTAREAAELAASIGVRRLALTHFSPRYADDPRLLEREAKPLFPDVVTAYDGMVIEVPYREA